MIAWAGCMPGLAVCLDSSGGVSGGVFGGVVLVRRREEDSPK